MIMEEHYACMKYKIVAFIQMLILLLTEMAVLQNEWN